MSGVVGLTGATGFIGRHLTQHLIDRGWRVRALTRKPAADQPTSPGIDWIAGDLDNREALTRLVDGTDAVVHCAGLVKARRQADFEAVNAIATQRLVAISAQAPTIRRLVLISSLAAREPHLSAYAASKRQAEELARAAAGVGAGDLALTVLRPPAVYGPGDRETLAIYRAVKRRLVPVPGGGRGRLSWIHVDDLSSAVAAALEATDSGGQTFEIDDGREGGYSLLDSLKIIAGHLGVKPLYVPIAPAVLRMVAGANLAAATVFGYTPMLTPGKARELCHPDWLCHGGAEHRLGSWRPRLTLDQGMAETLAWYRDQGLL